MQSQNERWLEHVTRSETESELKEIMEWQFGEKVDLKAIAIR